MNIIKNGTGSNSYLSFKLGEELFAIHVSGITNIIEVPKITKVPQVPDFMKGVINLRGKVLPLIDTKLKFGLTATEFTSNTCILVIDIVQGNDIVSLGILVDNVQEVFELEENELIETPSIGLKNSKYISNMARRNNEFIMILDVDLIFSTDDLVELNQPIEIE
jgi:purine-binding chemotaxis protein CheW